jgi:surface antigen
LSSDGINVKCKSRDLSGGLMSEIKVTTTDLFGGSNTLNAAAVDLGKVQVQLGEIIDAAGDAYDGQLRQALEDIIGPGVYAGGRLQNRAGELGRELSDRAMGFEEANVAGQSATLNASTAYINYVESTPTLGFISIIKNKLQSIGQSIWNVAGLTLGGLMSRFFLKAKPSIPSSFDSTPQPKPTPTPKETINNSKAGDLKKDPAISKEKVIKPIRLNDKAVPSVTGHCAEYAQQRRPDIGSTSAPNGASNDQGAYNYKYKEGAFQLSDNKQDLRDVIAPGYALVWDKSTPGVNQTYGHVAIIEEVYEDHVVVSHSGWKTGTSSEFTIDYISTRHLYIVP